MPRFVPSRLAALTVASSIGRERLLATVFMAAVLMAAVLMAAVLMAPLVASLAQPAHARDGGPPPLTVLSSVDVGSWRIMAVRDPSGTEACMARRALDRPESGQPFMMTVLRTKTYRTLRLS